MIDATETTETNDPRALLAKRTADQLAPSPYTFPGTEIPIKVRLLSEHEVDFAKIEAQRYAKKVKADIELDPDFLDREVQRQIVWRATYEPVAEKGNLVPLYPSDVDVRALDTVTLEALWQLYLEHQERKSVLRHLDAPTLERVVAQIRANEPGAATEFSRFDHASLVRVLISLAAHPPEATEVSP